MSRAIRDIMNKLPAKPRKVNGQLTSATTFYERELTRIVKGMFEIDVEDDWDTDYVLNTLIDTGYIAVANSIAGVLPFQCTFLGYNYTGRPTGIKVVIVQSEGSDFDFEATLGEDAELIYLDWMGDKTFWNFRRIIRTFAQRLASCDCAIDVNVMNSRMAYVGVAESKAQADAIKLQFDRVSEGEPLVIYRKDSLATTSFDAFFNNVKQNYVADVLQDTKRSIMNEFLTLLGINNANTDKKERLITSEVDSNDEELAINAEAIRRSLEECCTKVESTLGVHCQVGLKFDGEKRDQAAQDAQQQQLKLAQTQNNDKGGNGNDAG